MPIRITQTDLHVLNTRTRFPFRYGIASLTAVPHVFVRVKLEVNGVSRWGVASDGLAPKWFTKNPDTSFRDDLAEMFHVIESACGFAEQVGEAATVYDLWQMVYLQQMRWATGEGYPPLLWGFGVSLVERAMIEAFCRARGERFAEAVRRNTLGIQLGELNGQLADYAPADLLPAEPLRSVKARHTIGLADALADADPDPGTDQVNDGLPQSLEACIDAYGLTHFKIKLFGDAERDLPRLRKIASIVTGRCGDRFAFTLDGNEQFRELEPFRRLWDSILADAALRPFMRGLLFVEQPLHRDVALGGEAEQELADWPDAPPIIIDESDGSIGSAADALDTGYAGTSHKNCKGVIKGIANACLIAHRRRTDPDRPYVISGEDLCILGPVSLLQDLAVMANLGIDHVERNGHHYFRGLSMYPPTVQEQVLSNHADAYRRHEAGFAALRVSGGAIEVGSAVDSPLGMGFELDPTVFTPLDAWRFASLEG